MDTTDKNDNVIELVQYKNKKREQKQSYLFIGDYYKHISLPMAIKILAISINNPFNDTKIYLAVDQKGSILAFNEGEEALWQTIDAMNFKEMVDEANEQAQGTKINEEVQKS